MKSTTKQELRKAQIVNAHALTKNLTDAQYGKLVRGVLTDLQETGLGYPTSALTGIAMLLKDIGTCKPKEG